jgi:cell division protein FtsZ
VIGEMGKAKMGTGQADGDRRAIEAAEAAINNPLLEDLSMKSARGLLINITGSESTMTLMEVDEAVNRILEEVDAETDMIFGSTFDESLDDNIRISVVATGIEAGEMNQTRPAVISRPQPRPVAVPEPDAALVMAEMVTAETDVPVAPPPAMPEPAMAEMAEAPVAKTAGSGADMVALMEASVERTPAAAAPEPALAAEDSYIPPPPVYPEEPGHAEPFAAAALANGADPEPAPKRRRPGLLELMAEVAGVASGERRAEPKPQERVEPKASSVAAKGEARPAAPTAASQPALGDMEPAARPGPTEAEGEMLDIPAFLRRQAN